MSLIPPALQVRPFVCELIMVYFSRLGNKTICGELEVAPLEQIPKFDRSGLLAYFRSICSFVNCFVRSFR
jgi:hypothetical protein